MALEMLAARLRRHSDLSQEEIVALRDAQATQTDVRSGECIAEHGEGPEQTFIVKSGLVARCKYLFGRGRQMIALHVPGDVCNLDIPLDRRLDYSLEGLGSVELETLSRFEYNRLRCIGSLGDAFDQLAHVDAVVARTWTANLISRDACARLAHLMCELDIRASRCDLSVSSFKISQQDWADCLGTSAVQMNRCFSKLRAEGLIDVKRRSFRFTNHLGLAQRGNFNPSYLS